MTCYSGFGNLAEGRPFWKGDFNGNGRSDMLFYYPGDDNWWLGSHQGPGGQIAWSFAGNTAGFGHGINDGRPFWTGRFSRADRDEVLFYYPGDDNWWLGSHDGNQLAWSSAGNTGRPCQQFTIVHFKSLIQINNNINNFIDTQFLAMHDLFAEGGIAIYRGTTEDLSGNVNLQPLQNLNVGQCLRGQPTQDQNDLFANRNNVGNNELVIYIVLTLNGVTAAGLPTNPLGCATHPNGQPGAAVVQSTTATWLVAHEVGHVLALTHVCQFPTAANPTPAIACVAGSGQSDSLMFPNVGWTNTPPNLAAAEYTTMLNSNFTNPC